MPDKPSDGWLNNKINKFKDESCAVRSFGEKHLGKYLRVLFPNVDFLTNYRPDWLRGLELDFYSEDLKLGIEFNGEQHYRPIEAFGGEEKFKIQQFHDNLKFKYCREKNVTLIVVQAKDLNYTNLTGIFKNFSAHISYLTNEAKIVRQLDGRSGKYKRSLLKRYNPVGGFSKRKEKQTAKKQSKKQWKKVKKYEKRFLKHKNSICFKQKLQKAKEFLDRVVEKDMMKKEELEKYHHYLVHGKDHKIIGMYHYYLRLFKYLHIES